MKNYFHTRNLYLVILILFFLLQFFFKVKPRLRLLNFNLNNFENYSIDSENNLINLQSFDSRVNVGETLSFRDKRYWYKVALLSFWKKEYLNLNLLKKSFVDHDLKIKNVKSSNYALANHNNGKFVYACLDSPNDFYYDFYYKKVPRSNDFNHWKKVYINNIDKTVNKFKPSNYECLLIISSDKNFFKDSGNLIRNLIFSRYFNYSEKN